MFPNFFRPGGLREECRTPARCHGSSGPASAVAVEPTLGEPAAFGRLASARGTTVPGFRDVLGWLRFAGPPGPAAPAAVPADRRSRLLAEVVHVVSTIHAGSSKPARSARRCEILAIMSGPIGTR